MTKRVASLRLRSGASGGALLLAIVLATPLAHSLSAPPTVAAQNEADPKIDDEPQMSCDTLTPTLVGTDAAETLVGTSGPDVIMGLGGDDTIRGLGGDDVICGGAGDDRVFGGSGDDLIGGETGDDKLFGGPGSDRLLGQVGNDLLFGHDGDDIAFGGPGNDRAAGGPGSDILDGGDGRDRLLGDYGPDVLDGGPSHDYLNGGQGPDELRGGAGNDYLDGGAGTVETLHGGDGKDTIRDVAGGASSVSGGHGDDNIHITFTKPTRSASIDAGNGNDVVRIVDAVATAGDELLYVQADGGAGYSDEIDVPSSVFNILVQQSNFELGDITGGLMLPSRCGGNVTLMLDTSFSVPHFLGGEDMKSAAIGFISALDGTPTNLSVMGFDAVAYQLYPNLNGARGTFFATDDDDDAVDEVGEAIFNIGQLPNRDLAGQPPDYYIQNPGSGIGPGPNTDIGWTQPRISEEGATQFTGGTNWEDALLAPFYGIGDVKRPRAQIPQTMIWITDGQPNTTRNLTQGEEAPEGAALAAARAARDRIRADFPETRIIGVLVGPGGSPHPDGSASDLEVNMASVVGDLRWTGAGPDDLQNLDAADYIATTFDNLGAVLRSLTVSDCGGVVSIRKSLVDGSAPAGVWAYATPEGTAQLDTSRALSIPLAFSFQPGQASKDVTIFETAPNGSTLTSIACSANQRPVPATLDTSAQSVTVTVAANTATSCRFISSVD